MSAAEPTNEDPPQLTEEEIKAAENEPPQEAQDKARFPPPDPQLIEKAKAMSAAELQVIDKEVVEQGMFLFFNNQFKDAEEMFQEKYKTDPLIANAYGTLGTIKAMLSFEGPDIDEACQRLLYSNSFASKIAPAGGGIMGAVKSLGSWIGMGKKQKNLMTTAEFRALIVMGESELLRAVLLLLTNSMTAALKAGFCLRRGYNIYDRLQKYVKEYPEEHGADPHSLGGMHFGLGAIHVVTSTLPPKILVLLKALGYMHNRELGFEHFQKCLDSKTLRAPIASLYMLAFYGMLPSFAPLTIPMSIPKADAVTEQTLAMFPKSVIHLWLAGRVSRLKRQLPEAIDTFKTCVSYGEELKRDLPQLRHFALYDLAFALCSELRWAEAAECFKLLEEESNWSQMFYAYAQGCCAEHEGKFEEAASCFQRAESKTSVKIAGKVISIEQFVKKRMPLMNQNGYSTIDLPLVKKYNLPLVSTAGLELIMHFNCFPQTEEGKLKSLLEMTLGATESQVKYAECIFAQTLEEHQELRSLEEAGGGEDEESGTESSSPTRGSSNVATRPTSTTDPNAPTSEAAWYVRKQEAVEKIALLKLAEANIRRELKEFDAAEAIYKSLHELTFLPDSIKEGVTKQSSSVKKVKKGTFVGHVDIFEELWIRPYAWYENGVCHYQRAAELKKNKGEGEEDKIKSEKDQGKVCFEKIKKLYGGKDYSFEMQMQFRLHLTNDALPLL